MPPRRRFHGSRADTCPTLECSRERCWIGEPYEERSFVHRDLLSADVVVRHATTQVVQHPLERSSFRRQLTIERLAAEAEHARDRRHIGAAGMQNWHKQALNAPARSLRSFQIAQKRIGMIAEDGEGIARLDRDPAVQAGLVDPHRIPVTAEPGGRTENAIIFVAMSRRGMGNVDEIDQRRGCEPPRHRDEAREGGFGQLGKRIRVAAGIDQPERVLAALKLEAIRRADVDLNDQPAGSTAV